MITHAQLKELFDYDSETGNLVYRKDQRGRRGARAGDVAGWVNKRDNTKYASVKGRTIQLDRLVYAWHDGGAPNWRSTRMVHVDGDKLNTRIENLQVKTTDVSETPPLYTGIVSTAGVYVSLYVDALGDLYLIGVFPDYDEAELALEEFSEDPYDIPTWAFPYCAESPIQYFEYPVWLKEELYRQHGIIESV